MGKIEYNDAYKNIIKFPQVATTRMACPDMSGERELLEALNKVVRFEAQGEAAPVTEIALFGTNNDKVVGDQKAKIKSPSCRDGARPSLQLGINI